MSSTPFCLGIPVVDHLPAESGQYVLRSKDPESCRKEIARLRQSLTTSDLIKVYYIGYRPNHPVPVSRYFTEICIEIGGAEEWMALLPNVSMYNYVTTGLNNEGKT